MTDGMRRTADPYRDLAVIDARAPRFNQAFVGLLAAIAAATGSWPLLGVVALQLTLGLALGRRWCLPCRLYFDLVQPRVGEGPLEDARPPRFANVVGAAFLWAAAGAGAAGLAPVAVALGTVVAVLALVAAATGFCAGCAVYALVARARGVGRRRIDRIDLAELGVPPGEAVVVQFTHPLCSACRTLAERLARGARAPVLVDVSSRPELARKYGVAVVPLALEVSADGAVVRRLAG
jgi:thiol-disulfide isomerase/thioredoxin